MTQQSAPTMRELLRRFPRSGRVEWIGLSPGRRAPIQVVTSAEARVGTGLVGDRHANSARPSKREVTLIQAEHLPVIAQLAGVGVTPELLRRNLVVSGISLVALKGHRFTIGDVTLLATGPCAPCSRMEENLGFGGYAAMRGHGGITAKVLVAGTVRVGDEVHYLAEPVVS